MRDNNFDAMRLMAAVSVLVSHAFPLSYGPGATEPLYEVSRHQASLGHLAVLVFFVISGWLITESFGRASPARYAASRALRLLPGLAAVLLALAFVVGPVLTTRPLSAYFASAQPYRFVAVNFSLADYVDGLPGVFEHNPFPRAVNGSLWTLRYEAECYLIVFALGVSELLHRYVLTALLSVALLASWRHVGGVRLGFYSYFAGGAALHAWRQHRPGRELLRGWLAAACALVWAASLYGGFRLTSATAGAYVILYLGLSPAIRLPKVKRWGDLSYGTYVWAFPVQQVVTLGLGTWAAWWLNIALALPVTLVLAALSWHYIEAPALALKRRALTAPAALRSSS